MHRTPVRGSRAVLAIWLPLLALAVVLAGLPRDSRTTTVPEDSHSPVGSSALRVHLDPETGTLLPGAPPSSEFKAPELELMLSRSTDGLVEEKLANGAVRVNLQGRFQSASVAHIDENGQVHTRCSELLHEAEAHLQGCTHSTPQSQWEVK